MHFLQTLVFDSITEFHEYYISRRGKFHKAMYDIFLFTHTKNNERERYGSSSAKSKYLLSVAVRSLTCLFISFGILFINVPLCI